MKFWILIADAAEARIMETQARNVTPTLIHELQHPLSRAKGMDLATDRPGMARGGTHVDTMAWPTSPKETQAQEFAHEIATLLRKEFDLHHFEALALLAPAHFLGLLRGILPPELNKVVVFHQSKELSYIQTARLSRHLTEAVDAGFKEMFVRDARR